MSEFNMDATIGLDIFEEGRIGDFVKGFKKTVTETQDPGLKKKTDAEFAPKGADGKPTKDAAGNYEEPTSKTGKLAKDVAGLKDNTSTAVEKLVPSDRSTLAARARRSTFMFPMFITNTIGDNLPYVLAKAFERVYGSLVQTVMSQPIVEDLKDVESLKFLNQFHTNWNESAEIPNEKPEHFNEYYQPIDVLDAMLHESVYTERVGENAYIMFRETVAPEIVTEAARLSSEPLAGFSYLSEVTKPTHKITGPDGKVKQMLDYEDHKKEVSKLEGDKNKLEKNIAETKTEVRLVDSQVNKINANAPLQMRATIVVKKANGDGFQTLSMNIGVKTNLHLIRPADLQEDIADILVGKQDTLQKIRYKTGEITFWKGYMANAKNIKADATKDLKDKRWLTTLKRMGDYDKLRGTLWQKGIEALTNGSVPIPNATLVLSQTDVTNIKGATGIDLHDLATAHKLCKNLFLFCFIIVAPKDGQKTMKVLMPDMSTSWDTQSIASLEAEVNKMDNSSLTEELAKNMMRN